MQSLEGGEPRGLIRGAAQAHYALTGHIVCSRAGTLFAVPFDLATLQVTGAAIPVLKGVREAPGAGISQFAISPKGSLAYVPGGLITNEVQWVDRRGQAQPLMRTPQPEQLYQPRLSPNGEQLAIIVARGDDDVWTYDLKRRLQPLQFGCQSRDAGMRPNHLLAIGKAAARFLAAGRSQHASIAIERRD